ncbi:MAG TPA: helix-turn-helix transcriptional regulator [Acidimicrobiales bacterium]
MAGENLIGEYLRARRQLVRPKDVGLPAVEGRRRVPGLRRGEVALLAGVSTDYYIRLEQGRDQHPSPQVLDALARALQLDDDATAHLHRLASRPRPRRRRNQRPEKVPAGIVQLIESWTDTPAAVENRYTDVLVANPLAIALFPHFFAVGTNLVRAVFLDPHVRDLHQDWEWLTQAAVAHLRAQVGPDMDDPGLNELVGELSVRSERFRQLWARHDARPKRSGTVAIDHPLIGPMELSFQKLPIPDTDHQTLTLYHVAPGSPSAQALSLLAAMVAGDPHDTHPTTPDETSDDLALSR